MQRPSWLSSNRVVPQSSRLLTKPTAEAAVEVVLQLTQSDQAMLIDALDDVAEGVVFGVLCVLDGVRAIETGPDKGQLELYYVKGESRVLLNDVTQPELHDIFQEMRSFG